MKRLHIIVSGRVQGVGFRWFVRDTAQSLDLTGWVRNRYSGEVELQAQGEDAALESLCRELREGPPLARVRDMRTNETAAVDGEETFWIRH